MVIATRTGMRVRDDVRLPLNPCQQQRPYHSYQQECHHQQLQRQQYSEENRHCRSKGLCWFSQRSKFKGTSSSFLHVVCLLWLMIHIVDNSKSPKLSGISLMMKKPDTKETLGPPYPEPEFLPRLLNVTVREGGTARLPCAVHFLGTREVAWRRLGQKFFLFVGKFKFVKDPKVHLDFVELTPEVTEWNLILSKVNRTDDGRYECQVTSTTKMNRVIRLNVVGPPIVEKAYSPVIALVGKHYVDQGQPMKLKCSASHPDLDIKRIEWFKNGNVLDRAIHPHVVFTNYKLEETKVMVSELHIDRTRKNDTGMYICRSSTGEIGNLKVTILSANTPKEKRAETENLKRGNPDKDSDVAPLTGSGTATALRPQCLPLYLILAALITVNILSTSTCCRDINLRVKGVTHYVKDIIHYVNDKTHYVRDASIVSLVLSLECVISSWTMTSSESASSPLSHFAVVDLSSSRYNNNIFFLSKTVASMHNTSSSSDSVSSTTLETLQGHFNAVVSWACSYLQPHIFLPPIFILGLSSKRHRKKSIQR